MSMSALFNEADKSILHAIIKSHPLGVWVSHVKGELMVNHIPFILDSTQGEYGVLKAHVARANPVWKSLLDNNQQAVVIFNGANAYITPSWYPSKQVHAKVVPTWNYIAAHAHGIPRVIEDKQWLLDHLNTLTDEQEMQEPEPWEVTDAPVDYIELMSRGIVGIELPISRLEGKCKVSQNKAKDDKEGVIAGLQSRGDHRSQEMASFVARYASKAAK